MRSSAVVLVGLVALACGSDPTGPDLLLSFQAQRHDPGTGELPSTAAVATSGTITVTGGLETPCLAQPNELSGLAFLDGDELSLQVMWESANACEAGRDVFTYEAVLGNLKSRTYHLVVSHVFSPTSGFVTLDADVTVP